MYTIHVMIIHYTVSVLRKLEMNGIVTKRYPILTSNGSGKPPLSTLPSKYWEISERAYSSLSTVQVRGSTFLTQPKVPPLRPCISCPIGAQESKSMITGCPWSLSMIFVGLISLCTRPRVSCRNCNPFAIPETMMSRSKGAPLWTASWSVRLYFLKHMAVKSWPSRMHP